MNDAKVVLRGNLIKEPILKDANGTKLLVLNVIVSTNKKDDNGKYTGDFYDVGFFGKFAETLYPKLQKGTEVLVIGDQTLSEYKDKNGTTRICVKVTASDVRALARQKTDGKTGNDNSDSGLGF